MRRSIGRLDPKVEMCLLVPIADDGTNFIINIKAKIILYGTIFCTYIEWVTCVLNTNCKLYTFKIVWIAFVN